MVLDSPLKGLELFEALLGSIKRTQSGKAVKVTLKTVGSLPGGTNARYAADPPSVSASGIHEGTIEILPTLRSMNSNMKFSI